MIYLGTYSKIKKDCKDSYIGKSLLVYDHYSAYIAIGEFKGDCFNEIWAIYRYGDSKDINISLDSDSDCICCDDTDEIFLLDDVEILNHVVLVVI